MLFSSMELIRGVAAKFEATFVDIDGEPLVPANPDQYPQIQIKDPLGNISATGVGDPLSAGKFIFNWFVPVAAELSTDASKWAIEWFFITITGHSKDYAQSFDVVDKIEATPEERKQTYLCRVGGTERLLIRWPRKLYKVTLEMQTDKGSPLLSIDGVATDSTESDMDNPQRVIVESEQAGEYIYYYDTDGLLQGEYTIFWDIQETAVSARDSVVQVLRVVPVQFWHYAIDLRMLIDKLQKRTSSLQAYADPDLYSYILGGLHIINFIPPTTNWILTDIPLQGSRGVRFALMYAAAIHALISQQTLETELSFNFGGQTVTLDYNHDYSGVLAAINEMLTRFAEAKPHIYRLAEGVGAVAVRPYNWNVNKRIFRADAGFSGIIPPENNLYSNVGL